ncbi:MAG TPA: LysR family transcriptional regulator [Puia sp.]|nr:LysR family transcriptional regulator [Puia sp.]
MARSIKHFLKKGFNFQVTGSLWIECDGERFLGPGKVELLERIADTGSINKAAKQMGMSYKKAWGMVKILNKQTAKPFVIVQTGGEKGGGSTLTEEAWQLIKYHRLLRERFTGFLKKETNRLRT